MQTTTVARGNASRVLGQIVRTYPAKLSLTGGLIVVENALDLVYPLVAGLAIDAVLGGDTAVAASYVVLILAFWGVGAARRAVDTRVYSAIYSELAADVVRGQRRLGSDSSAIHGRTALARQFVDFFEIQVPVLATARVSVFGSVVILSLIEPVIGAVAGAMLALALVAARPYLRRSEYLAACLHDRQEREAAAIESGRDLLVRRHFRVLGGRRVRLSDLEARAYVGVGLVTATLFAVAF
jgi:ABC-type multidrug transport system fused ATPase/permease subunit